MTLFKIMGIVQFLQPCWFTFDRDLHLMLIALLKMGMFSTIDSIMVNETYQHASHGSGKMSKASTCRYPFSIVYKTLSRKVNQHSQRVLL